MDPVEYASNDSPSSKCQNVIPEEAPAEVGSHMVASATVGAQSPVEQLDVDKAKVPNLPVTGVSQMEPAKNSPHSVLSDKFHLEANPRSVTAEFAERFGSGFLMHSQSLNVSQLFPSTSPSRSDIINRKNDQAGEGSRETIGNSLTATVRQLMESQASEKEAGNRKATHPGKDARSDLAGPEVDFAGEGSCHHTEGWTAVAPKQGGAAESQSPQKPLSTASKGNENLPPCFAESCETDPIAAAASISSTPKAPANGISLPCLAVAPERRGASNVLMKSLEKAGLGPLQSALLSNSHATSVLQPAIDGVGQGCFSPAGGSPMPSSSPTMHKGDCHRGKCTPCVERDDSSLNCIADQSVDFPHIVECQEESPDVGSSTGETFCGGLKPPLPANKPGLGMIGGSEEGFEEEQQAVEEPQKKRRMSFGNEIGIPCEQPASKSRALSSAVESDMVGRSTARHDIATAYEQPIEASSLCSDAGAAGTTSRHEVDREALEEVALSKSRDDAQRLEKNASSAVFPSLTVTATSADERSDNGYSVVSSLEVVSEPVASSKPRKIEDSSSATISGSEQTRASPHGFFGVSTDESPASMPSNMLDTSEGRGEGVADRSEECLKAIGANLQKVTGLKLGASIKVRWIVSEKWGEDGEETDRVIWWPATIHPPRSIRQSSVASENRPETQVYLLHYIAYANYDEESTRVLFKGAEEVLHLDYNSTLRFRVSRRSLPEKGDEHNIPPEKVEVESSDEENCQSLSAVISVREILDEQAKIDHDEGDADTPSAEIAMMRAFQSLPYTTQASLAGKFRFLADAFRAWLRKKLDAEGGAYVITSADIQDFFASLQSTKN